MSTNKGKLSVKYFDLLAPVIVADFMRLRANVLYSSDSPETSRKLARQLAEICDIMSTQFADHVDEVVFDRDRREDYL